MNIALLPNDKEFNFRNVHYKSVLNVLDGDISCAICNLDLKKNIILNEKILVHEMFLCICCKDCFEKLSDLQNGCILCSENIQLKSCIICNSNMCQRCVHSYCSKSKKLKKLKNCLRCSINGLWTQRSETAAVLRCFSFELNSRLKLSGEECEDKQHLYKFIINTAKCNNNIFPNDILYIRMKYLYSLLNSKIKLAMDNYQIVLQNKDVKQCIEHFSKLCEQVLKSTCEILDDFKCFFNEDIIESLSRKVKSILKNSILFKNIENGSNETVEVSCTSYNALNSTISGLIDNKSLDGSTSNSNVSLESLDENIINQHLSNKADISTSKNIVEKAGTVDGNICSTPTCSNELNEVSNQKSIKLNSICSILGNLKELKVCLVKLDENMIGQKLFNKSFHLNTKTNKKKKAYLASKGITKDLKICVTRCDQETIKKNNEIKSNKEIVGESSHLNIESNKRNYLASKGITKDLKIILIRFDQMNTNNNNEIKSKKKLVGEKVYHNTESSENINFVGKEEMMCDSKIYLTRFDQMNIDNNNEVKSKNELVGEKVHLNTESSENINFVGKEEMMCDSKIYLTRFDQMNIDNNNEVKSKNELVDGKVHHNTKSSKTIEMANKQITKDMKINPTRFDEENIHNHSKIKSIEEMVGESSQINAEPRKLGSVGILKDSVIDLTRFDEENIENGVVIESNEELPSIAASQIVHKNNKLTKEKSVEIISLSYKENILKNLTNSDPFKEFNVIFKMIDEDTIMCKTSPIKKKNENYSEENTDSKPKRNIKKRKCRENSNNKKIKKDH